MFGSLIPASDGQFKCQIYHDDGLELYIANAGRLGIEGFYGWGKVNGLIEASKTTDVPDFSHSQIQTFIGSIGMMKGYDVWIPMNDRNKLDWSLTDKFLLSKMSFLGEYEPSGMLSGNECGLAREGTQSRHVGNVRIWSARLELTWGLSPNLLRDGWFWLKEYRCCSWWWVERRAASFSSWLERSVGVAGMLGTYLWLVRYAREEPSREDMDSEPGQAGIHRKAGKILHRFRSGKEKAEIAQRFQSRLR